MSLIIFAIFVSISFLSGIQLDGAGCWMLDVGCWMLEDYLGRTFMGVEARLSYLLKE